MSGNPGDPAWDAPAGNVVSGVARNVVQANMITGDLHIHNVACAPVGLPYRVGSFPPRATAFQDRDVTRALTEVLAPGETVVPSDSVVVSGLGGVGKTQVALDYADRVWASGEADLVVWVTAASRGAITSSFARLAAELTGIHDLQPDLGAQRLLEWLAVTRARWLIVLDDLQRPDDLRGLWPPTTPAGRVVVTTRRRDAALRGHGRRMLEVGLFTPDEAHTYLRTALADQPSLLEGSVDLGASVGYLPLALAQASAYLRDRNLSCADYQRRLTDRRRQLASLLPESDALPDEHGATVAATWSLSVEQANQLQPQGMAGPLLEVASLLDPNGIPLDLFTTEAIVSLLATTLDREVDQEQTRDGLNCLRRLSLITLDLSSTSPQVRTHALVQRATRDTLTPQQQAKVARAAADALLEIWPKLEPDLSLGQVLRANTDSLFDAAAATLWQSGMHYVLQRVGWSLEQAGLPTQVRDHYQRLHISATTYLGPDHPDTLHVRMLLDRWNGELGDPARAVAMLEALLARAHQLHGPDHVLNIRHNLAAFRGKAGDPDGAAAAFKELLADFLRRFGPDHPGTLNVRHRYAYWCGKAGAPAEAAAVFKTMLPDCQRVLGIDEHLTLTVRRNLARWRGEAGDPAGTEAALEDLLADYHRVLGPDHPYTLKVRRNLAHWRGEAGDPAGTEAALEDLLADYHRVLGPDHPYTLNIRSNLAHWTRQANGLSPTENHEG